MAFFQYTHTSAELNYLFITTNHIEYNVVVASSVHTSINIYILFSHTPYFLKDAILQRVQGTCVVENTAEITNIFLIQSMRHSYLFTYGLKTLEDKGIFLLLDDIKTLPFWQSRSLFLFVNAV